MGELLNVNDIIYRLVLFKEVPNGHFKDQELDKVS